MNEFFDGLNPLESFDDLAAGMNAVVEIVLPALFEEPDIVIGHSSNIIQLPEQLIDESFSVYHDIKFIFEYEPTSDSSDYER